MEILFLSVEDLEKAQYKRKGKKNLLKTRWGTGDTVALCGKLVKAEETDYGPRLWIDDGKKLGMMVGAFNEEVKEDAQKIRENFEEGEEMYLLAYGNPYFKDRLYINVNQDNGVTLVGKETYQRFHEMEKKRKEHLRGRKGLKSEKKESKEEVEDWGEEVEAEKEELSYQEVDDFLKSKGGKARIEEIEQNFSGIDDETVDEKILELMESGRAYEPEPGLIKLI